MAQDSRFIICGTHQGHVRNLYLRSYVADGNFKADHLKQKNDDTDVWLTDGEGFMTERSRYEAHLNAAKESTQVIQFPTSDCRLINTDSNAETVMSPP